MKSNNSFRSALNCYIKHPEKYPNDVLYYDSDFTVVYDKYPKAQVHLLVLPRDLIKTTQSPFLVFNYKNDPDKVFQNQLLLCIEKTKPIAIQQLVIKFPFLIQQSLNFDEYFKVGFHAIPSLSNLHVHVISKDNLSERLKTKKHYISFNSPFLLNLYDLIKNNALNQRDINSDEFFNIAKEMKKIMAQDMKCWKCGLNFRNDFKKLKDHLVIEANAIYKEDREKIKS
ncbi:DNA 5'-adenosine monophosphate hydrolase [Ascoidea rubescens DSM 1968]|uniref:HIT-like protein n=1 Tax=Ascoidea rubescens DSM 1968 TaxID=1344418 RepID=A0A1D2VN60_9ASCO|nr:HIT-like protein [Ascoidea rubescens DSM 1968]ODV63029.1 HIT-like protein [Ascoidea rubescens DSM 1968]